MKEKEIQFIISEEYFNSLIDNRIKEKYPLLTGCNSIKENTTDEDFSDNEPKVRVIILEKLGIIDYVKSIQQNPETIQHTAKILSAITGINSGTLYSYLRPMLQPHRDDEDKNSPYKNGENLIKANKTIHKLNLNPDYKTDAN